jgi:arylsulfatase A-like enzyme
VPNHVLDEHFNPDDLLPFSHAYAGQVSLLDQLIGSLLDAIKTNGLAENSVLVCISPRGFPLGEHLRIGPCDEALYAELTHVPCTIRFPTSIGIRGRCQHLLQPADISDAILASCGLPRNSSATNRDQLSSNFLSKFSFERSILNTTKSETYRQFDRAFVLAPPNQQVFVTSNWSLRLTDCLQKELEKTAEYDAANQSTQKAELFVKPDDWFEINEVSNRCPEIMEKMHTALDELKQELQTDSPAMLAELPVELTTELK